MHCLIDLLKFLRPYHPNLPKDPRTLLKTKTSYNIADVCGGQYYHFGLLSCLKSKIIPRNQDSLPDGFCLQLQLNIDGLPLFKSTNHQFWPILGKILNVSDAEPFIIGLFSGQKKPSDLDEYLRRFIDEYLDAKQSGFEFESKRWHVEIHSIICDAPARAFVKCVKSHSGYYGCDKCCQSGEWQGKMTFPDVDSNLRTDQSFQQRSDEDHHTGLSPFCRTEVGMVSQFPLDYMHLVCLGVMKRLLLLWIKGPLHCRLGSRITDEISTQLLNVRNNIPCEFARKPRSLQEIDRWKATEFRQFLLYTGPVILSQLLHPNMYQNFLLFFVGIHILVNKSLTRSFSDYAGEILVTFVTHFCQMYGSDSAVYNVHSLVHLAQDAKRFGSLECISAFPFENFLSRLKKMVRKPHFPLQQVIRRLSEQNIIQKKKPQFPVVKIEHRKGPLPDEMLPATQYRCLKTENFTLKLNLKDSCVRLGDYIGLIQNILLKEGDLFIVYKKFRQMEDFFTTPLPSSQLGILKVSQLSNRLYTANITDIQAKCVLLPRGGYFVVLPYSDAVWTACKFAVVEFLADQEVEVVPVKWLSEDNKQCRWPNFRSTLKIQAAVKQMATPTAEYKNLSVRVLYKTEDYLKARQKLALAEITSDLQTEAEEESQSLLKKRKKRPNPRFQDDDDDDETEDDDTVQPQRKSPRKGIPKRHLPPLPPLPTLPQTSRDLPQTSRDLSPSPERRQSPRKSPKAPLPTLMDKCIRSPVSDKRSSQPSSIDLKILTSIEGLKADLKTELRQNTHLLQAILKRMDSNATSADEPCDFEEEQFPLSSKAELFSLENKLKDNEVFNKLVRNLGTIGGENVKSATRLTLTHLFTDELARKINWMGKGEKIAFSKLRIRDAVAKSIRKNRLTLSATDSEINAVAKDWFRFAPDRSGGRKQREEKKREEKKREEEERRQQETREREGEQEEST